MRERLANHTRMRAFLRVGRPVAYPLDLPRYLPPINRTEEMVAEADAQFARPKDQLLFSQFWFMKASAVDEVAFNHLFDGDLEKAEEIWQRRVCFSSLQNRIVLALVRGDYAKSVPLAETLYGNTQYVEQLASATVGAGVNADASSMAYAFLDTLCGEVGASALLPHITNEAWKSHITEKATKTLVDSIRNAIDQAKRSRGQGAMERLVAGETLKNTTSGPLSQLKSLLSTNDLQYQMTADKLGMEILQCGIDYCEGTEDLNAAERALELLQYAKNVVVDQVEKDKCEKEIGTLQQIPKDVFAENSAIRREIRNYCSLPDKICHSVTLLNNSRPYLQTIKRKHGASNDYYAKISTEVVQIALHNVIAEVNEAQSATAIRDIIGNTHLKYVLAEAWKTMQIMDTFDMTASYKRETYNTNRATLENLCLLCGVPTYVSTPRTSSPTPKPGSAGGSAKPTAPTGNGCGNGQPIPKLPPDISPKSLYAFIIISTIGFILLFYIMQYL